MPVQKKDAKLIYINPDLMFWVREYCKKNGIVLNTVFSKMLFNWAKKHGYTHKDVEEYELKNKVKNDIRIQ